MGARTRSLDFEGEKWGWVRKKKNTIARVLSKRTLGKSKNIVVDAVGRNNSHGKDVNTKANGGGF